MRIRAIWVAALVAACAGCGGSDADVLRPGVRKALARVEHSRGTPVYYLGATYGQLRLVFVDTEIPQRVDLVYADCTAIQADTGNPACKHVVEVDNEEPAQGEISTQGRCFLSTTIRGATAAFFPVNPQTLRVFTRGTTIYVSARVRDDALAAARALRGLNNDVRPDDALPHRDVSRVLGRCRERRRQPPPTAKEVYQQRMKSSFYIQTAGAMTVSHLSPHVARPHAVLMSFLNSTRMFPLILRNEATRIDGIPPPAGVGGLQKRLSTELRAYADDVDRLLAVVRSGAWKDEQAFRPRAKAFDAAFAAHSRRILAIVAAFRKHGYTISVKPTD